MSEPNRNGLFSSIALSHLILLLHGLVIFLFVLLAIFFHGVLTYLPWIMAGGCLLLIGSGWLLWRRLQRSQRSLRELLDTPLLRDRGVELKLLGGVASLRLGAPVREGTEPPPVQIEASSPQALIEDGEAARLRRLARLVKLREQGELDEEEFALLRRELETQETAD